MARWYEFRAEVAQAMDLHYSGQSESVGAATVVDTDGLARFTETSQLVGGTIRLWLVDSATGTSESEWRNIIGYDGAGTVTVEHDWVLSVLPIGYPYELFRALTPDQWDLAIEQAIKSAWPMIFEVRTLMPAAQQSDGSYVFDEPFDQALQVRMADNVAFPGFGERPVPPARWTYDHGQAYVTESGNYTGVLRFMYGLPAGTGISDIKVVVAGRYEVPDKALDNSYPTMDHAYLMAQSQANAYGMLAGATQRQAVHSNYMTQAQYQQTVADRRKQEVASALAGTKVEGPSD